MDTEAQIQRVISAMGVRLSCLDCGTRIQFGNLDCPHCGADLDELLRLWAENLLGELEGDARDGYGGGK